MHKYRTLPISITTSWIFNQSRSFQNILLSKFNALNSKENFVKTKTTSNRTAYYKHYVLFENAIFRRLILNHNSNKYIKI